MKFDMHCHTEEGSIDGKVSIKEYIEILKEKGFSGMLVTDHNSYNGYREYRDYVKEDLKDFVVLKGIEYDTLDGGHILVIMPETIKVNLLECRGLSVKNLQDVVHRFGGILGPAHPCGGRYLSITQTRFYTKNPILMHNFDFLEGYNSCETVESNQKAKELAFKYQLPTVGGSDSHRRDCVGTAYTVIDSEIQKETDLIQYIKTHINIECGGSYYEGTVKKRLGMFSPILAQAYWVYNRAASIRRQYKRKNEWNYLGEAIKK